MKKPGPIITPRARLLLISLIIVVAVTFILVFVGFQPGKIGSSVVKKGNVLVTDKNKRVSVQLPAGWDIRVPVPSDGVVALISAQSPDYKVSNGTNDPSAVMPTVYESGARFDVMVFKGIYDEAQMRPVGTIIKEDTKTVDGVNSKYYVYRDLAVAKGESHELRFGYAGNIYYIKYTFNPDTNKDGEAQFTKFLSTFTFAKTE